MKTLTQKIRSRLAKKWGKYDLNSSVFRLNHWAVLPSPTLMLKWNCPWDWWLSHFGIYHEWWFIRNKKGLFSRSWAYLYTYLQRRMGVRGQTFANNRSLGRPARQNIQGNDHIQTWFRYHSHEHGYVLTWIFFFKTNKGPVSTRSWCLVECRAHHGVFQQVILKSTREVSGPLWISVPG